MLQHLCNAATVCARHFEPDFPELRLEDWLSEVVETDEEQAEAIDELIRERERKSEGLPDAW